MLRPLPLLLGGSWLALSPGFGSWRPQAEKSEVTAARVLARNFNLSASPSDIHWVDPPPPLRAPWRPSRAWALAQEPGKPNDVLLLHTRRSPEGALLDITKVFNLTETSAANESRLVASGALAGYSISGRLGDSYDETTLSVHLLHANAGAASPAAFLSPGKRVQLELTRLQRTGQRRGLLSRSFKLDPPASEWWLAADSDKLLAWADGHELQVPLRGSPAVGGRYLAERTRPIALPGNWITWLVDRARGLTWFGDERMQLVKAVAYKGLDTLHRSLGAVAPRENAAPITAELGTRVSPNSRSQSAENKQQQWPPPPLRPFIDPGVEGEGEWFSLEKDPFVRSPRGGGSAFFTAFIRPDMERKFSRVLIAMWDAREVELHMESGTEEPKSATGEHGTGLIPRTPDILERTIAAFNGGFQGTHGGFGMMVNRTLLVPPRPYGATIARMADSSIAFGTWPNAAAIPPEMVSFRQNLTPLVAHGKLNPYERLWWGGVPQGWEDDTRTVRSGLCLTQRGHVAYFYGSKVDHAHLGKAMLRADCQYGVHLDMNQGHTGLEFYNIAPADELPPLGMRPHPMWQAEGKVSEAPEHHFRGRRLFRSMQLMNFPRYIQRGERDFFYLTLRHRLPGPSLRSPQSPSSISPMEGLWRSSSSDTDSRPPILARTFIRPSPTERPETKVHLLQLDSRRLRQRTDTKSAVALTLEPPAPGSGNISLWLSNVGAVFAPQKPSAGAVLLTRGRELPGAVTRAAWGVSSATGFATYALVATVPNPSTDGELLRLALTKAGCDQVLFLDSAQSLAIDGLHELSGHPAAPSAEALSLTRAAPSYISRVLDGTPTVKRAIWKPLQDRGF